MSQSRFISSKRPKILEESSRELNTDKPVSQRLINRPPSEDLSQTKPKAIQENKLNNFLLSQIRGKAQNNRNDLSYSSKISDNSKKSDKSGNSQVKKNSLNTSNTKVTLNSKNTRPTQNSGVPPQGISLGTEKAQFQSKLNSQMIQVFLSKKTPTNIQTKTDFKLNSDQQKKTETPKMQLSLPTQKTNGFNKTTHQDGLQNLLKIQMNLLKRNNLNKMNQSDKKLISQFETQQKKENHMIHITAQHSRLDVTESNDGFKCYEDGIHLQPFEDNSMDQPSFLSLEKQYHFISSMYKKEQEYALDAYYLLHFNSLQEQITPKMRAQVVDWMQQVCMEYMFKRETFHLACYYLDAYLNKVPVAKEQFQLLGLAAIQIATKLEEIIPPSIHKLLECTSNSYGIHDINTMEISILKVLKYKLNPQTKNVWGNFYLVQWDNYMTENLNNFKNRTPVFFKKPLEQSYLAFREFFQLLEYTLLDISSFQFPTRVQIAAVLFLVIGRQFGEFDIYSILNKLSNESLQLITMPNSFNSLFDGFLIRYFSMQLDDIIPAITFLTQFYEYQLSYDFPRAVKKNQDQLLESHFEDFQAYQTYNPYNSSHICKM